MPSAETWKLSRLPFDWIRDLYRDQVPESLHWTDSCRGESLTLTTLNVRLRPYGHLAARAYGRPTEGGRGTYVSFPVPDNPELTALIVDAAACAGRLWAENLGLG